MHPLKKVMKEAENQIREDNRAWFEGFMEENYPGYLARQEKEKIRKRKLKVLWVSLSSSMAAVVAIVASLVLLLPLLFPAPNVPPKKHYLLENEREVVSDLAEMNADLSEMYLEISAEYEGKVRKVYDSISSDTLFYKLEFKQQNEFVDEKIIVYLYVNLDYEILMELEDSVVQTTSIDAFTITYNKKIIGADFPFLLSYHAITEYNGIAIYIEYEQLSLDEEGNFFNFFEQTFRLPGPDKTPAGSDQSDDEVPNENPEQNNPIETPVDIPEEQTPQDKHYAIDEEMTEKSELSELNTDLHDIRVEFGAGFDGRVERAYDSDSGDTLYYRLVFENPETTESPEVWIYANPYYTDRKELKTPEFKTSDVGGFALTYSESVEGEGCCFLPSMRLPNIMALRFT